MEDVRPDVDTGDRSACNSDVVEDVRPDADRDDRSDCNVDDVEEVIPDVDRDDSSDCNADSSELVRLDVGRDDRSDCNSEDPEDNKPDVDRDDRSDSIDVVPEDVKLDVGRDDRSDCSAVDVEDVKPDVDRDDMRDCNSDDWEDVKPDVDFAREDRSDSSEERLLVVEPAEVVPPLTEPEPELGPTSPALSALKSACTTSSPNVFGLIAVGIVLTMAADVIGDTAVVAAEEPVGTDSAPIVANGVPLSEGEDAVADGVADGGSLLTLMALTLAADACSCSVRAVATRSLRRVLLLTPLRSLWTQVVNWALVGSVPRIDSYRPVTT